MIKLKRWTWFWVVTAIFLLSWLIFAYLWYIPFPYDVLNVNNSYYDMGHKFGLFHKIYNTIHVIGFLVAYIVILVGLFDDHYDYFDNLIKDEFDEFDNSKIKEKMTNTMKKMKKGLIWGAIILLIIFSYRGGKNISKDVIALYNTSVDYRYQYDQNVQEKAGFYDNMWKSYLQVEKNTTINKDVFLEVTKVVMESRKDGEGVAWKWVQENQNIPYEEFTKFYSQLNNFIINKREGYFKIEKRCQEIAYQNNKMLDTFPNNIYKKFLNIDYINFEYGILSTRTKNIIDSKLEEGIIE